MPDHEQHMMPETHAEMEKAAPKRKVKDMRGANQRRTPKRRGQPFKPSDSLVSFTLR